MPMTLRNVLIITTASFGTNAFSTSPHRRIRLPQILQATAPEYINFGSNAANAAPSTSYSFEEEEPPPNVDLNGRFNIERESNLFRRSDSISGPIEASTLPPPVREEPNFGTEIGYTRTSNNIGRAARPELRSQLRPNLRQEPRQEPWQKTRQEPWQEPRRGRQYVPRQEPRQGPQNIPRQEPRLGSVQGTARRTYHSPYFRDRSHVFLETDGRPLDAEFELWDGPNNTPTKIKVYSEDGYLRPFNAVVENPEKGRSSTLSVRNTGPYEFPLTASLAGDERAGYMNQMDFLPSASTAKGQIVQGNGALKTYSFDAWVDAVHVTIVTDGLPMYATVELWGAGSHVKQIAEIYNDNGATRPFSAIVDTPGGSNTIAIRNTGPIEYPIRTIVEPVKRMDDDFSARDNRGGYGDVVRSRW